MIASKQNFLNNKQTKPQMHWLTEDLAKTARMSEFFQAQLRHLYSGKICAFYVVRCGGKVLLSYIIIKIYTYIHSES